MSSTQLPSRAVRSTLERLLPEIHLQIFEQFDTERSLDTYLSSSTVLRSIWLKNRRKITLGFARKRRFANDAFITSLQLHHLYQNFRDLQDDEEATIAQLANIAQTFTSPQDLDDKTLEALYWIWRYHECLVDDALSQPWLNAKEKKYMRHHGRMEKWWRSTIVRVAAELPGRLFNGFFHVNLFLRLARLEEGSSPYATTHTPYILATDEWAQLVGLVNEINPHVGQLSMRRGPGLDMLLVATAMDHNRLLARNRLVDLFRPVDHHHGHRKPQKTPDGGTLLQDQLPYFLKLRSMFNDARHFRNDRKRGGPYELATYELMRKHWDWEEELAIVIFDAIQMDWRFALFWRYGPGMTSRGPPPFSQRNYNGEWLPYDFEDTIKRGSRRPFWTKYVNPIWYNEVRKEPPEQTVERTARKSTRVLADTKAIREFL